MVETAMSIPSDSTLIEIIKLGAGALGFIGAFLLVWFTSKYRAKSTVNSKLTEETTKNTQNLIDVMTETITQLKILSDSNKQRALDVEAVAAKAIETAENLAKTAVDTAEAVAKNAVDTANKLSQELTEYREMQIERDRVNDVHQAQQTKMLQDAATSRQETIDKLVELELEVAELKKIVEKLESLGCQKLDCPDRIAPQIPIKTRRKAAEKKEN